MVLSGFLSKLPLMDPAINVWYPGIPVLLKQQV